MNWKFYENPGLLVRHDRRVYTILRYYRLPRDRAHDDAKPWGVYDYVS